MWRDELEVFALQQGGAWYGNGLVPTGEHRPTVARAFGDVEGLAFSEQLQHWQVVDAATASHWESESRDY